MNRFEYKKICELIFSPGCALRMYCAHCLLSSPFCSLASWICTTFWLNNQFLKYKFVLLIIMMIIQWYFRTNVCVCVWCVCVWNEFGCGSLIFELSQIFLGGESWGSRTFPDGNFLPKNAEIFTFYNDTHIRTLFTSKITLHYQIDWIFCEKV